MQFCYFHDFFIFSNSFQASTQAELCHIVCSDEMDLRMFFLMVQSDWQQVDHAVVLTRLSLFLYSSYVERKRSFFFNLKFYSWFSFTTTCTFTANNFHHYSSFLLSILPFCVYLSCEFHLFYSSFLLSTRPFSVYLSCDFIFSPHLSSYPVFLFLFISDVTFIFFYLSFLLSILPSSVYLSCNFNLFYSSFPTNLFFYPVFLFLSLSAVTFNFSPHLSSYSVYLLLPISPVTFILSTYLFSYSVYLLLPISSVTFILSSIQSSFF